MVKRKIRFISTLALIVLIVAMAIESLYYQQRQQMWRQILERRLHAQEHRADELLSVLQDSISYQKWFEEEDITLLAFRQGELLYWSKELLGSYDRWQRLDTLGRFGRVGNTYYEIRKQSEGGIDYYALIRILDRYPYSTPYVKSKFADFLGISEKNTNQLTILSLDEEGGEVLKDEAGNPLFKVAFGEHYREVAPNYLLLPLYLFVFLCLFYVYGLVLNREDHWRRQLCCFVIFALLLGVLHFLMQTYHWPQSIYQLLVFEDRSLANPFFISSVGDFLLTVLEVTLLLYVTLVNWKVNYAYEGFKRFRYVIAILLFLLVFASIGCFNLAISSVVEHIDVRLNMAQLIHVGSASILTFIAINLGGLIILGLFSSVVFFLSHVLTFKQVLQGVTLICLCFLGISQIFDVYIYFWDCLFFWVGTILIALSRYRMKGEIQRSVYILLFFLLAVYVVMIAKKYERSKELRSRMDYATELIEERDALFESYLLDMDSEIAASQELIKWVKAGDNKRVAHLLKEKWLDETGYVYQLHVALVNEQRLFSADSMSQVAIWEKRIRDYGRQIGTSSFYSLNQFDGVESYCGRFLWKDASLYVFMDLVREEEEVGYSQILNRHPRITPQNEYPYSYAKYVDNRLVNSNGFFPYYKQLRTFGADLVSDVEMLNKDRYSHMIIMVDKDDYLVISLPEDMFALYYMNIWYAFILCVLLFLLGSLFRIDRNLGFEKRTLKSNIRNGVVLLIAFLLIVLTSLNIYMNTRGFENRHRNKAIEFLQYVSKELQKIDVSDYNQTSMIWTILREMSDLLMVDINIYALDGRLLTSSRPEIIQFGFDGGWINPKAWTEIVLNEKTNYIGGEQIGELDYMSTYMLLDLDNGKSYILNVPYFTQSNELKFDIFVIIIIMVNVAIVMLVFSLLLSALLAVRLTKPLEVLNEKLRKMRLGGGNERILYRYKDEIGELVCEYNNMVDKLEENIAQLARSERESAWREMARQIAHEIKNPLTPMKLNIQFMLRSMHQEDSEKFKQRFQEISTVLIDQIDHMAAIASAFSDFAKISVCHNEVFEIEELVRNCILLFRNDIHELECQIDCGSKVNIDREQMRRVMINLLKNAEQSIPSGRKGLIRVVVDRHEGRVRIRVQDNGCGIPLSVQEKIFEPNFTTKSSGSGLGLAICQKIINGFGGEIGFKTEQDVGTEFYLLLEAYAGDAQAIPLTMASSQSNGELRT